MYKAQVIQIIDGKCVGKALLTDTFYDIDSAIKAALDNSRIYDYKVFQIREYNDHISNTISFDENDTGSLVCESLYELVANYIKDDVDIVEWLEFVLEHEEDALNVVATNISDEGLTDILRTCGADDYMCKRHKIIPLL